MKSQLAKLQLRHTVLMAEMQLHSRLAKTLENLLRQELSHVEQCYNEMESFSIELLKLQKEEELEEPAFQNNKRFEVVRESL